MQIEEIPFEVTALLGTASLPQVAYMGLHLGDILVLDQTVDQRLVVRIGKQERYQATAGLFITHKAVTLDERIHS